MEDSARYAAGETILTLHGRYLITAEEERNTDLSPLDLNEGEVRVEWYRDSAGPFLVTRAGPGTAVGLAGLGSELDAAWTGAAWVNFGRGGADQVAAPALARFTWVFEANSGDQLHGTLIADSLAYGPGDSIGTAYGTYRITTEAMITVGDPAEHQAGQVHTTRYVDATVGRDLALESDGATRTGTGGFGSELDRAWSGTNWVSVGQGGALQADGQAFDAPRLLVASFAINAGGWLSQEIHPRLVADLDGDGRLDIAGFGNSGVWASGQNISGGFDAPRLVVASFGVNAGGWTSQDRHPRSLVDVNGDGLVDIVGFGDAGVYGSLQDGTGGFLAPQLLVAAFGVDAGNWTNQSTVPRFMADIDGDGRTDIIGFSRTGVFGSLQDVAGTFAVPQLLVASFGVNAGGWESQERHPRLVADLNGDGRIDIAGFGNSGVWASMQNGSGGFDAPRLVVASFGVDAGGWMSQNMHPRSLADINGDGRTDIVGFGNSGVWASLQNSTGSFDPPRLMLASFGVTAGGWTSQEQLPRMLADLDGDGRTDVVGFGNSGVWGSTAVSLDLI
ncbi:MAG TPA: VCBS repeat-containing protein [Falsiroseomonas sp.]|nr:VCBS repeat-containing protein [Falsiroseomonas sp.]